MRFYLERAGTVVAVDTSGFWTEEDDEGRYRCYDAVAAVTPRPNAPVASTTVSTRYLRECKRISQARAMRVHPALFDYLGDDLEVAA